MKRDMTLIREILLAIEAEKMDEFIAEHIHGDDHAMEEFIQHMKWIDQAGFVKMNWFVGGGVRVDSMTWEGCDFLDSVRNEDVWHSTLDTVAKAGGSVAVETLKAIATAAMAKMLGLS